jgi:hypothetical protein
MAHSGGLVHLCNRGAITGVTSPVIGRTSL